MNLLYSIFATPKPPQLSKPKVGSLQLWQRQSRMPQPIAPTSVDIHLAVKARVDDDLETIETRIFNFTQSIGHVAMQEDLYFNVPYGQLKLRITKTAKDIGQLISSKPLCNMSDHVETKCSDVQAVSELRQTLNLSLKELGMIKKRRRVYVKDDIRINLDEVEDLGLFVDIEIRGNGMEKNKSQAELVKIALNISDSQIVSSTYLELYRKLKMVDSAFDEDFTSDSSL